MVIPWHLIAANAVWTLPYPIPSAGLQVEIYLGVLFVRRVDAKVKSGRINLIGFEL